MLRPSQRSVVLFCFCFCTGLAGGARRNWIILYKYNAAPENGWLEDDISFWDGLFSDGTLDIHDKNKALIRGY